MSIRHGTALLVILGTHAFATGASERGSEPSVAKARLEVPTSEPVPVQPYNKSVLDKRAGYCGQGACDAPPTLIHGAAPIYPPAALAADIEGRALVRFDIDTAGYPVDIEVESATAPEFGAAAVAAVRMWRFSPARLGGKATNYRGFRQSFPFELRD